MTKFTRRSLVQGATALGAAGALTGPALLDFAKAWAQAAPWKPEKNAKLNVLRWVGSSRVDLQACKLEYSIVSPK